MSALPKKPYTEWTREELLDGRARIAQAIAAHNAGDLADMRVARDEADPHASTAVLDANFQRQQSLGRLKSYFDAELAKRPIPIDEHPRDGADWLLYHRIHGWITGRFCKGEMVPHHEYGPQYEGPVWVLGDDIEQVEVEESWDPVLENTILYHDGPITHYLPLPMMPPVPTDG